MFPRLLITFLVTCNWLATFVEMTANKYPCSRCPGSYCGRTLITNESDCNLDCDGCERGFRSDGYFCLKCDQILGLYDWLFLGFMVLCVTVLNFYAIDTFHSNHRKVWFLHLSALCESVFSFIGMVLVFEPAGTFTIHSCGVTSINDWYTKFFNPDLEHLLSIHCTQEAVYPLFTAAFVYLIFSLLSLLIFRGVILRMAVKNNVGRSPLYVGLYIIPIVGVIHTCLAGVIYYVYPYLTIFLSAIGVAVFLSTLDCHFTKLKPRHIGVLVCYGFAHGYGIISITRMEVPIRDGPVLLLIFLPFSFYMITRPFTDAGNFKN